MLTFPEFDAQAIHRDLRNILSEEYISTSLFERLNNALDPWPDELSKERLPYIVVRPETTEEVSRLLKYSNENRIPVFVRGSGTGLTGASRYSVKGIVLNTNRLTSLEVQKDYGYFECGPGHRALAIQEALDARGYFLPMAPGSIRIATLGGIISNNTSGHVVDACLGKPADYVLGLEVVLPSGEVLETGTKSLRKPAGTDLTKLFVGGDGLLGVITKIRLRLVPAMKKAYGVAFFEDLAPLARGVQRMYYENAPLPLFMEFMDKNSATVGFKLQGLQPPPGPVIIFLTLGHTDEEASQKADRLVEVLKKEKPIQAQKIEDMEYWQTIWRVREVMLPYLMQEGKGAFAGCEIVSTLANLQECLQDAIKMSDDMPTLRGMDSFVFGHIGALTIHVDYILPAEWPAVKKVAAVTEVLQKEAEINLKYGTCGGEWGQFSKRNPFYLKRYGEQNYKLVIEMKKLFDPNNILNPGILMDL
jgi:glycolate oxidase